MRHRSSPGRPVSPCPHQPIAVPYLRTSAFLSRPIASSFNMDVGPRWFDVVAATACCGGVPLVKVLIDVRFLASSYDAPPPFTCNVDGTRVSYRTVSSLCKVPVVSAMVTAMRRSSMHTVFNRNHCKQHARWQQHRLCYM
jgi:hypothetical protein